VKVLRAAHVAQERIAVPTDRHCCVYAESVLRIAFGSDLVDAVPPSRWRIFRGEPIWSPVLAANEAGIALEYTLPPTTPVPLAGADHLCQGWRRLPGARGAADPGSGHTFLWHAVTSARGWRVDSTEARGPKLEGLLAWADVIDEFQAGVAVAALRPPPR